MNHRTSGDAGAVTSVGQVTVASPVGYRRPPVHSRFKPGQSGNPKGRAKNSQDIHTLFQRILREKISLREGARVRKVSKAEAVLRGLVVGALKGDQKSVVTLLKLADDSGRLQEQRTPMEVRIVKFGGDVDG